MKISRSSNIFERDRYLQSLDDILDIDLSSFVGESDAILQLYSTIAKLSDIDSSVLILGESGSGKELIAQALHKNSPRSAMPMVTVNCAAIPEELLESELFGHERGSFTGALRSRAGKFELANGGTIFLDEIGDMHPSLQVKLLRVLQEQEIERVGGLNPIRVNVRIIAATNQDLEEAIKNKKFREDLYYRLNVVPISTPPLRERRSDIPILANHFIEQFNRKFSRSVTGIDKEALKRMINYSWPGNVRELKHLIERIVALKGEGKIDCFDLPEKIASSSLIEGLNDYTEDEELLLRLAVGKQNRLPAYHTGKKNFHNLSSSRSTDEFDMEDEIKKHTKALESSFPESSLDLKAEVDKFETSLILAALDQSRWVKNKAAMLLGLNRTTLVEKLKKKKISKRPKPVPCKEGEDLFARL